MFHGNHTLFSQRKLLKSLYVCVQQVLETLHSQVDQELFDMKCITQSAGIRFVLNPCLLPGLLVIKKSLVVVLIPRDCEDLSVPGLSQCKMFWLNVTYFS